ncbi:MAG: thioredoxin family protein [Methanoregula sp.]|nr:thioredoxin family protein [Methanoregula sp.]
MDRIIKIFIGLFVIVVIASLAVLMAGGLGQKSETVPVASGASVTANDTIAYFFYGEECPHCKKVEPFIDNMTKKYPDIDIRKLEIWHNQTNEKLYTSVNAAAGISSPQGVPEVVIGKVTLVGEVDIPAKMEAYLQAIEKKKQSASP